MASSSSSSVAPVSCVYDVFLSFRGEDTRHNFTSHLDSALRRKKLKFFIDEELERGDEISMALLNAIETSKISVIIFSQNYASSRWCLDELVKILDCHKMNGQIVIPVFYHVDPSDVRKQTGSFGGAFVELAKRFKKMPEKVQKWKDVLTEASNKSGFASVNIRSEAELVDEIVEDILKKLKHTSSVSNDFDGFVGLHSRIQRIKSLLCLGLSDFRIVGIWGMGGIGKTTIAGAIFNQMFHDFERKSFMANVREESKRCGLEYLREQLLCEILEENLKIKTPNLPGYIKERLQRTKVFIVLDDVNESEQLNFLAGGLDRFGPGSRVIVTTRDKQVLDKCGVDYIYEVERLNYYEASELFCNYAFRQDHCTEDLQVLSESMRHYANGNPLALKVLGCSVYKKSKEVWANMLHKLQRIPDPHIYDLLKISYDELNWEEKNIFLDIACFFIGHNKNQVIAILGDRYSIDYGFNVLVDKSLVVIVNNVLQMHDLLQEMGWKIVHEECEKEPGKRSRLWSHEHVCHVLKRNKGTDAIEGIFMDLSKISDIHLSSTAFSNMSNLRLLKFYTSTPVSVLDMNFKVHLPENLEYLSDELRYLYWHGYPLITLPKNFNPENLIELSLPYSNIQRLWEGRKEAPKLKYIDLSNSQFLTRIPDPSETPNLERINLLNCKNFSNVPSSIQNFNNLGLLCFEGCTNLTCFPHSLHFRSPIKINLSFCINLTEFPQISGNIVDLNLRDTRIEEVPSSIKNLTGLENLNLWRCTRLMSVSTSICELKSLRRLDLSFCSKFERFPEILEPMESLEYIALSSTKIKELPSSIEHITGLTKLKLSYCSKLDSLPQSLGNLRSLKFIEGDRLAISLVPSSIKYLNKLEKLEFDECRGLVLPPLSGLSSLNDLSLKNCEIVEIPEDIGCLTSLEILDLSGNNFENLPKSINQLYQMRSLYVRDCNMLQSIPELHPRLEFLSVKNCKRLESLPELPKCLENLDASILSQSSDAFAWSRIRYIFSDCPKLKENANYVLTASQVRIQYMAIASLKLSYFSGKEYDKPARFDVHLPGSGNIPEWFSNRCSGSSITIQLPQHPCNSNFIGFALCAVYGFENDSDATGIDLEVKYRYSIERKTPSPTEHFGGTVSSIPAFNDSDRVFLGFNPCWDVRLPVGDHHSAVSFQFFIDYLVPDENLPKVKCCGVCPVYAHPNESPPDTFTIKMLPPSEEECTRVTSGSIIRSEEEEVELICKEQINAQQKIFFWSQVFWKKGGLFAIFIFAFLLFILGAIQYWKIGI